MQIHLTLEIPSEEVRAVLEKTRNLDAAKDVFIASVESLYNRGKVRFGKITEPWKVTDGRTTVYKEAKVAFASSVFASSVSTGELPKFIKVFGVEYPDGRFRPISVPKRELDRLKKQGKKISAGDKVELRGVQNKENKPSWHINRILK